MKPESPFSKLPSLHELLSHPTVAKVVKRVNQTTIAQRATGFLEEMQSNLRQRLEQGSFPSLGQLAEKFARRLLGPAQTSLPAVNATGSVLGERWPTLPLPEPAADEILRLATEYHAADQALVERVNSALVELTGAEAAWVTASFAAAAEVARNVSVNLDAARYAGFLNPGDHGLSRYDTISDRLEHGAELVAVDGAGLIGGPPCGIVVGKRDKVEECSRHAPGQFLVPLDLTLAALATTLTIYQTGERVIHQIPVWQLLSAPLENLEQRCQRLATLMSAGERIASATPTQCESFWCDANTVQLAGPSWAIVVNPRVEVGDALATSLLNATPQIIAREQGNKIWLDLRSVFPRWDQHLVSTVE